MEINPKITDDELIKTLASDTWGYFFDMVDRETGLPMNNVVMFSTYSVVGAYTSITDIGFI